MLKRFLSYYKPQMGLFVADTVCALVLAAIDLAFPIILRNLTGGLFTQGQAAIMQALGMIAVGLVLMYAARCACKHIEVTEDFFAILGIPLKQVYRERARLLKADPEEIIFSSDVRLIAIKVENWTRKAAAGLARMKAKREVARQRKQEYYSLTFA